MQKESLKFSGELQVVVTDTTTGEVKYDITEKNLVVNLGLAHIISRLKDASATVMSYIGVGTSSTIAIGTHTDLLAVAGSRLGPDSGFPAIATKTVANDTLQFVTTFPPGASTGALIEAGIFNAPTAGTMMCRTVFSAGVVNKGALDSMTITWKVTAA
jgi:hypothetical protein